jgi:hypothetical protein
LVRAVRGLNAMSETMNADAWLKIARLHAADAKLDDGSMGLMTAKYPTADAAAVLAEGKTEVEAPLVRAIRNFESSIALDTVKNEYLLHRRIHEWLATSSAAGDVLALNRRVYTELFLTPREDPWLGLVPADTYSALDHEGLLTK